MRRKKFLLLRSIVVFSVILVLVLNKNYLVSAVTNTTSLFPVDDTYVRSDNPNTNYGANTSVYVDGNPIAITYMKFDLSSLAGKTIVSAKLRLVVTNSTSATQSIKSVEDTTWSEAQMTYNSRPGFSTVLATADGAAIGTLVEIDLTSTVAAKVGQLFAFGMDQTGDDGIMYSSEESSTNKPTLFIEYNDPTTPTPTPDPALPTNTPTPTSTPTPTLIPTPTPIGGTVPMIVAAGDMVADLSKTPSSKHKEVSDLIVSINPDAVLALGDVQYESGEYANFINYYDPTWGRFVDKTYPAVGNHEYITAGAAGYFDYYTQKFGGEGNTAARPGARSQGYYSFDIGTWHLISLNTQCSNAGGCSVGSPQEKWLRADLAAHSNMCTLAFWHIPLYSSGGRANSNSKSLWQALYDYNADVVLTGHDHTYERFAPQDANANLDVAHGIREFVVGTGGKNHTSFTKNASNSEVKDKTSFGVVKLTLQPTSYDWEFVPISGNTFTDSGSTPCH